MCAEVELLYYRVSSAEKADAVIDCRNDKLTRQHEIQLQVETSRYREIHAVCFPFGQVRLNLFYLCTMFGEVALRLHHNERSMRVFLSTVLGAYDAKHSDIVERSVYM